MNAYNVAVKRETAPYTGAVPLRVRHRLEPILRRGVSVSSSRTVAMSRTMDWHRAPTG